MRRGLSSALMLSITFALTQVASFADDAKSSSDAASADTSTTTAVGTKVSAEKKALILELLSVTKADKLVDNIVDNMMSVHEKHYPQMMMQLLKDDTRLTEAQKKSMIEKMDESQKKSAERMRTLFHEKINLPDVLNQVALQVYDKYFTDAELKDIIAFYKTPTGKKSLEVMPQVLKESMTLTSQIITPKVLEIVHQLSEEARAQIDQAHTDSGSSTPAAK